MTRDLPVAELAVQLGHTLGDRGRRIGPCPACSAEHTSKDRRRPPVALGHGGRSWRCYACGASGDAVDLVSYRLLGRRGRDAGQDFHRVLAWLSERQALGAPIAEAPAPAPLPVDAIAELVEVLRVCRSPADVPEVAAYLRSRAIDPAACPAGVLPASFVARVSTSDEPPFVWWPAGWSRRWPLVVPAVDARGYVRSLHARHVPGYGPDERPSRKSTWPRDLPAQGLVFADPARARPWLHGKGRPPAKVLVVEGITDFLTVAGATLPDLGVIGIESGSAPAFADMPWGPGQAVYLATHPDKAGVAYREAVLDALPAHVLARVVPLHRLAA